MLYITTNMFDRLKANRGLAGTFYTFESIFNRKYKGKTNRGKFKEILTDPSTGASAIVEMDILSYKKTKVQLVKVSTKGKEETKEEKGFEIGMVCNLTAITSEKGEAAILEDYIMDSSDISDI